MSEEFFWDIFCISGKLEVLHGNDNVWLAGSRNVRFKEL
jgi:hypothetical protein